MKVLKYLLFFIIFLFLSCSEDENVLNKGEGQLGASTSYYVSVLYHCVWGWGGKSNGYFYWNYNILASNVVGLDINDNYNGYQAAKHELMDLHFMSNFKKVLK